MTARRWLGPSADTPLSEPPTRAANGEAPAIGSPAEASPAPSPASPRQGPWRRWGRWLMLALCALAGALFAWNPDTWDGYPIVAGMASGAFATVACVHLYGLVAWALMRGI